MIAGEVQTIYMTSFEFFCFFCFLWIINIWQNLGRLAKSGHPLLRRMAKSLVPTVKAPSQYIFFSELSLSICRDSQIIWGQINGKQFQ